MTSSKIKKQRRGKFTVNGITVQIAVPNIWEVLYPSPWAEQMMENLVFSPKEKRNSVIDMGTGSGVLGIFSILSGCKHVTMTDISPAAVECAQMNLGLNKISDGFNLVDNSDLFERLTGLIFDVIICNPPPLPDIPELRTGYEIDGALLSGPDGMNFILRLLECFDRYLAKDGRLILAHPSFWSSEKTVKIIKSKGYTYRVIGKKLHKLRMYHHFNDKQYEALIKKLAELSSNKNGFFFLVPGTEFSVSVWEIKKRV